MMKLGRGLLQSIRLPENKMRKDKVRENVKTQWMKK
jgi:hypothetical protein